MRKQHRIYLMPANRQRLPVQLTDRLRALKKAAIDQILLAGNLHEVLRPDHGLGRTEELQGGAHPLSLPMHRPAAAVATKPKAKSRPRQPSQAPSPAHPSSARPKCSRSNTPTETAHTQTETAHTKQRTAPHKSPAAASKKSASQSRAAEPPQQTP